MELTLPPETKKIIEDSVRAGEFSSAEEMVTAAIQKLKETDPLGHLAPGELDRLIEEGLNSGEPIPFETFLTDFDAYRKAYREGKK